MIKLIIGSVLFSLAFAFGTAWVAKRMKGKAWRPGVGMLALACIVAGVFLLTVVKIPPVGSLLLAVGMLMSMGVRRSAPGSTSQDRAPPPQRRVGGLSPDEARDILGVGPEASAEEVQAAYLRLIRRNHPDQGGSTGLAAQLNAARDVLLGKG
jgi:hypothetical protein